MGVVMKRKASMPEGVREAYVRVLGLYFDDDERAYLRASAEWGRQILQSDWCAVLRNRPRVVV